jgi:hypothetical protein
MDTKNDPHYNYNTTKMFWPINKKIDVPILVRQRDTSFQTIREIVKWEI